MLCNFIFAIVLCVVLTISPLAIASRYMVLKAHMLLSPKQELHLEMLLCTGIPTLSCVSV